MKWWRKLFNKPLLERQLNAELQFHLEQQVQDYLKSGMDEVEARRKALITLGGLDQVKEECREVRGIPLLDAAVQDLRYAGRTLRRTPGFVFVAVATLAIGIGATTAIFGHVNAVFFKMLPVKNPEELRTIAWTSPKRAFANAAAFGGRETISTFSFPAYLSMRDGTASFSDLACWANPGDVRPVIMADWGRVEAQIVSGNYFQTLGANALLGRTFASDVDRGGVKEMVAVVSWGLWQRAFNGDVGVLDRTVTMNGSSYSIIGVMPREFFGMDPLYTPEIILPMATMPPPWQENNRDWTTCEVVGRIRPGISDEHARAELETLVKQAILIDPPSEAYEMPRLSITDAGQGHETVRRFASKPLLLLMSVATVILLIACANIAGLLLARAAFRQKEMATRLALGATRMRLIRQLLTESLLLSAIGGIVGTGLAYILSRLLPNVLGQFVSSSALGATRELGLSTALDLNVLAFAITLVLLTGVLFGFAPALHSTRVDLLSMMKQGSSRSAKAHFASAGGKTFIAAQVALSILLLVGAGLFIRTVINMRSAPLGYDPEGLLLFRVEPRLSGYTPDRRMDFFENALKRLDGVPGVTAASGSVIPLLGNVAGSAPVCGDVVGFSSVAPDFFDTMRLPLLLGRDVEWTDREDTPKVALLNEAFAKKYYPGQNPIGQQVGRGPNCPVDATVRTVIGVVSDSQSHPRGEARPTFYPAYRQLPTNLWMTFVVRTIGKPSEMIPTIRRVMAELDANVPILDAIETLELRDRLMSRERLLAGLLILFGSFALLLCSLGIYGVLAYRVRWRTAEIGVRMALGAQRRDVIRMVIRESLTPVVIGVALGLASALALTHLIESMLFGVANNDPWTIAGAAFLFLLITTFAAFLPAQRASRIDPTRALRYE